MQVVISQNIVNSGEIGRAKSGRRWIAWGMLVVLGALVCLLAVMQGAAASSLNKGSVSGTSPVSAPSDCGLAWHITASPNAGNAFDGLTDVAVLSDSNIWSVGYYTNLVGQMYQFEAMVQHWNGSTWSLVTVPQPGEGSYLYGVSAFSASDIWAVGYYFPTATTTGNLILHYNGTTWTQVTAPNIGTTTNILRDVVAVSATSAWAVGSEGGNGVGGSAVLYWDGSSWASVPSPNPNIVDSLVGVTATSADDMWAVGYYRANADDSEHNYSIHCTRAECTVITTPNGGVGDNVLGRVKALSSSDVWAVGHSEVITNPSTTVPTMMHWNGEGWSTLPTPPLPTGTDNAAFSDVLPISDNAVWAVGSTSESVGGTSKTYAALWNGSSWVVSNPSNLNPDNGFAGVGGLSADDIWSVGYTGTSSQNIGETLAERYNDPCITPTPTPPACSVDFTDVPQGSTFYPYVHCLSCQNILGGYTTGCPTGNPCFKPSSPVTRGQLAKIVSNAAGFSEIHTDQAFEDVASGSTFYDFVERLASREIIGGYACGGAGEPCGSDNLPYFRPNAQVTRGQTSKIVAIADNLPAPTPGQQTFEDVAPNSTFWQWVESLATAGTIGGYPCGGAGEPCGSDNLPYFRPSADVTRGQAAKIVSNTFFPDCSTK